MSNKIKATKVSGWDECTDRGDYFFDDTKESILFMCPCGCGQMRTISTKRWNWDGNEDSPTLTPSIQVLNECKWHGFLTNGEWITA